MASEFDKIKELYIKLSLVGSKKIVAEIDQIVKALKKLDGSTEEVDGQVSSVEDGLDKFDKALDKAGKTSNKVASGPFAKLRTSIKSMVNSIKETIESFGILGKVALKTLSIVGKVFQKTGGFAGKFLANQAKSVRRIFEFTAGDLLADGIRNIAGAFRDLARSTIQATISEEKAVYTLRQGLFLRRQYTQALENQFVGLAGDLQRRLGIDADLILTGIGRTIAGGVAPALIPQVTQQAASLSEIFGRDILTVMTQIQQALTAGLLQETLTAAVPQLKRLARNTEGLLDQKEVLDTIQKAIGDIGEFQDRSLSKELERLSLSFSELLKTAGRPIAQVLRYLARRFTPLFNFFASRNLLDKFGQSISRAIASIFNLFPLGREELAERLQSVFDALARGIRFLTVLFVDFSKFLLGQTSLIGKYLEKAELPKTIVGLIKFLLRRLFDTIGSELKKSNLFGTFFKSLILGSEKTETSLPQKFEEARRMLNKDGDKFGMLNRFNGFGYLDQINPYLSSKSFAAGKIPMTGQSGPVFNNNINISTSQPVDAIARQIKNQAMLSANMGRRS